LKDYTDSLFLPSLNLEIPYTSIVMKFLQYYLSQAETSDKRSKILGGFAAIFASLLDIDGVNATRA
jgi:hypothetical protein